MGKGRKPCCDKTGLKKGPWTPLEDQKLISFIQKHGHSNWRALPKQAGLLRCGKSCRLRWINYLRPDIKRGNFTQEEEETIIRLHESLGNKWSFIATHLPGRTDNEIKNVWNTHLKNKLSKGTNPSKDNNPSEFSISSSSSSTSNSNVSYSGIGIEQEEYIVLCDTQKEGVEETVSVQPFINNNRFSDGRTVQSSNWMVQSKSNFSPEEAREVSSPSYSTCSSYVSHPFKQVVEVERGEKTEEHTPHQQLKSDQPFEVHDAAIEELLEIPFEPDILGILDDNVGPLSGIETHHQQTVLSGDQEQRKEGESRNSWVAYLEYELGLQEEITGDHDQNRKSLTGNDGFEPQGTNTGSIDEMLMETEMDPVSMYFQMWPSSPLDFSLLNQKQY